MSYSLLPAFKNPSQTKNCRGAEGKKNKKKTTTVLPFIICLSLKQIDYIRRHRMIIRTQCAYLSISYIKNKRQLKKTKEKTTKHFTFFFFRNLPHLSGVPTWFYKNKKYYQWEREWRKKVVPWRIILHSSFHLIISLFRFNFSFLLFFILPLLFSVLYQIIFLFGILFYSGLWLRENYFYSFSLARQKQAFIVDFVFWPYKSLLSPKKWFFI